MEFALSIFSKNESPPSKTAMSQLLNRASYEIWSHSGEMYGLVTPRT